MIKFAWHELDSDIKRCDVGESESDQTYTLDKVNCVGLTPDVCMMPNDAMEPLEAGMSSQLAFPDRLPNLDEAGTQLVTEAMRRANGNQTIAATLLGITRQALAKRLKKLVG